MKNVKQVKYVLGIAILVAIALLGISAVSAQSAPAATVKLSGSDALGPFLVDANGMTLYVFTKDSPGKSTCTDQCATAWPPLMVQKDATPTLDTGIIGRIGVITRPDGTFQAAFNGMPLYYYAKDTKAGDTTGNDVGGVWYVAAPSNVSLSSSSTLGSFLVDAKGMTLYMYTKDTANTSTCTDQCATAWPPLLFKGASDDNPSLELGLDGKIGTITRADGGRQVTYNGMPLYYFAQDTKPGDANGQNVGQVWFVIQPQTLRVGGNDALGKFLVGPDGMTLYTYTKDSPGTTTCYDKCATAWPPLLVGSDQKPALGDGVSGKVDVIKRTDGTMQITYNGMPLYYWFKDVIPGDATGQNVGQVWFIAAP